MDLITVPDLKSLSLTLCILLSSYTTYLCGTPPNPTPYKSTNPDSMSIAVTPSALFIRRLINVSLGIYHAFLTATYPSPPRTICPQPSHLAPYLFTWTPHSIICITAILLACSLRLSAFSALGPNFTFRLAAPKKLVTSGLYSYVQHPSYTGKAFIVLANIALIQRADGAVGCWLPDWIVEARLFGRALVCLFVCVVTSITWNRVKDEEMMLKSTFGKEWEAWHERTKRFIPGLF
jgi:protein-S-isoprenylcysteine O-methyltransferase Ste14